MAAITGQASQMASSIVPKYVHSGVTAVYSEYTVTATLSITDVIEICKVPDGARVVSVCVQNSGDIFDGKMNIGTAADHDQFMASETFQSRTVFGNRGLGAVLDVSDDASVRYTTIKAKISDSTSASGSSAGVLRFCVMYTFDQANN